MYNCIMACCLFGIAGHQVLNHDTQAVSTLSAFLMSSEFLHVFNVGTPIFVQFMSCS